MFFKFAGKRPGAVHTVQQPEGVPEFIPQFRRGEGELLLRGQRVQKAVNRGFIHKAPCFVDSKKFIQVKSVLFCLPLDLNALRQFIADDFAHLVGEQVQTRQAGVGVAGIASPITPGGLLIGVSPVENCLFRELIIGKHLEGRARQVKGEAPADVVKGNVRAVGVNAFVGFVNHQHVPLDFRQFFQLHILTAKLNGTLQILSRDKLNQVHRRDILPSCLR